MLNFCDFIQVCVFTTNHHLKSSNGNMCYSTKDISNALGGNFQKNSSSSNYSQQFQDIKMEKERENMNFQS